MLILLGILKWIGIIIALLLAALIILILLLLFVPVRYELFLKRDNEEEYLVSARGGWLMRLLHFHFRMDEESTESRVGLLFFTLFSEPDDKELE